MAQPDIADFQVDLTESLKGKIDLTDIKDVNSPNPVDGEVLTWNGTSNKWEPTVASSGVVSIVTSVSEYIDLSNGMIFYDFVRDVPAGTSVIALPAPNNLALILTTDIVNGGGVILITSVSTTGITVQNTLGSLIPTVQFKLLAI